MGLLWSVMCSVSDNRMRHNSSWVCRSSGIWHCVLKKLSVSIFSGQQIPPILLWPLDTEGEGTTFLQTTGTIHPVVQHYISQDQNPWRLCCENLKSSQQFLQKHDDVCVVVMQYPFVKFCTCKNWQKTQHILRKKCGASFCPQLNSAALLQCLKMRTVV